MVGRLILAKMVVNSLRTFLMQVQKLPTSILNEVDKCVRRCVWWEHDGKTKIHLLAWELLCGPKEEGGFSLRTAEGTNKALLVKLGWWLPMQGCELCEKIIRKKYGFFEDGPMVFKNTQRVSPTWGGLEWASDLLCSRLRWKVVTGGRILFWRDVWLEERPLLSPNDQAAVADGSSLVRAM